MEASNYWFDEMIVNDVFSAICLDGEHPPTNSVLNRTRHVEPAQKIAFNTLLERKPSRRNEVGQRRVEKFG